MTDMSDDLLKQLWQQQPVERAALTLKAVQKKVSVLQRRAWVRRILARAAIAMMAVIFMALLLSSRFSWPGLIYFGSCLLILGWNIWLSRKHGTMDRAPVDSDLVSFVDYSIREHQRQLDLISFFGSWQFIVPSLLLPLLVIIYTLVVLSSEDLILVTFLIAFLTGSFWIRIRELRSLRNEISNLENLRNDVIQIR